MLPKLQYISQGSSTQEHITNIHAVLDAGGTFVQLRLKDESILNVSRAAEKVQKICSDYKATFILNDYVEVAQALELEGVHVGLDDMKVHEVRALLKPNSIIGGTANNLEHVIQRISENCTYVGLGPFAYTETKKKLSPILGLEGYLSIASALQDKNLSIPIYAIGGITLNDITLLTQAGVYGVAVSGLLTKESKKHAIIQHINTLFK